MQRSGKEVRDVKRSELIGLDAVVVASGDPTLVGLTGRISDESKSTFLFSCPDGRERRVAKKGQTFEFATPAGPCILPGVELHHAPQNRIKKSR